MAASFYRLTLPSLFRIKAGSHHNYKQFGFFPVSNTMSRFSAIQPSCNRRQFSQWSDSAAGKEHMQAVGSRSWLITLYLNSRTVNRKWGQAVKPQLTHSGSLLPVSFYLLRVPQLFQAVQPPGDRASNTPVWDRRFPLKPLLLLGSDRS